MAEKRRPESPNDLKVEFKKHVRAVKAHQRRITSRATVSNTDLHTEVEKREKRDAHPYDGIRGQPPEWLPMPLRDEFNAVRNRLLDRLESESIGVRTAHRWMDTVRPLIFQEGAEFSWTNYVPPEYDRDIIRLVEIQGIVNLGPQDGITAYLGRDARQSVDKMEFRERQSKWATKRRPDPLQVEILRFISDNRNATTSDVLAWLRTSPPDGIRVIDDDVTDDGVTVEGVIEWSTKAGVPKETKISALKDRVFRARKQLGLLN